MAYTIASLLFAVLFLFFGVGSVFAGEPPIQSTPSNGSTTFSSTLNWSAPFYSLYPGKPYRIQVDDDLSFPSQTINKDYYTKNTYYNPVLNEGTWYWRVKAKDSSGIWSDWSNVWSFILQASTQSTPTLTPAPSPTPIPTPTIAPNPTTPLKTKAVASPIKTSDPLPSVQEKEKEKEKVNAALPTSSLAKIEYRIASVAGEATATATLSASPNAEIKSQKQLNFPILVGLALMVCGFGSLGYVYLRNKSRLR